MTSALPDHLPGDDDFVLAGRPLRPGFSLADTARFGEDEWRLEPAILQEHVKSLALTFQTVPSRYRLQAKQLFYAVLAGPLPPGEKRLGIATARSLFVCVKAFLKWLDARPATDGRPAHPRLGDLTGQDLRGLRTPHCRTLPQPGHERERPKRRPHVVAIPQWAQRPPSDQPSTCRRLWARGSPTARERDRSHSRARLGAPDRMVDAVRRLLLSGHFGRRHHLARVPLPAQEKRPLRPQRWRGRGSEGLLRLPHRTRRSPYPGHRGLPNWRFISAAVGVSRRSLDRAQNRELIDDALSKVGVTEYTWLPVAITGTLDGAPWVNGVAVRHPQQSLERLARLLQISCYILIAFFSGMRDSEKRAELRLMQHSATKTMS